jgi:hypothetical protein
VLLPLSVFGGHAVVRGARAVGTGGGRSATGRRTAAVTVAVLAVTVLVAGAAAAAAFDRPVERNAAHTDDYRQAYAPFEPRPPADAIVFVPTPYGPWLNHPLQPLRNDPGFDGRTVYAQERDADTTWAVLDAYPDRTPYRYRYRGEWTPKPGDAVEPTLRAGERVEPDALRATTTVGAPPDATSATVAVASDGRVARTTRTVDGDRVAVDWRLTPTAVTAGDERVAIEDPTEAELRVTVVGPQGGTVYYELELLVRPSDGRVEVLWPPERQVCVGETTCEDAYVPGSGYPSFVDLATERR